MEQKSFVEDSWFDRLARWLREAVKPAWTWVLDIWHVVRLARVAIAVSILGCVLFVSLSQSKDVLLRLGESPFDIRMRFFLVLFLTTLTLWYWTRIAIASKALPSDEAERQWLTDLLAAQLPRLVGMAPAAMLAWEVHSQGSLLPGTLTVLAASALIVWGRRPFLRWLHGRLRLEEKQSWMMMPPAHSRQ